MSYASIKQRMKALEAKQPKRQIAGRHIVVDLVSLALSGQLTDAERRRRVDEARSQAGPCDRVIVIDCRWREGDA